MSRFLNEKYNGLTAYTPGEQPQERSYVKLNTNESPFPPAPGVAACLTEEAAQAQRLYPDPQGLRLRRKIVESFGLGVENVMLGNGSDDILHFAFMAYGGAGAAFADITYGFYRVFAALHGVQSLELPLREDFSLDERAYFDAGRTVFIANPNAPTGMALPLAKIEAVAKRNPDNVVLVDEAYVDFGAESALSLLPRYENLLVVRTFSKSRSLAGARLGFAMASPGLIADLELLRYSTNPYNVSRLTLAMGEAALEDTAYFESCRREILANRAWAKAQLEALGFTATDSKANFLFVRHPHISGMGIYRRLKEKGLLVRHFETPRLRDYNRITIGTRADMEALAEKLKEIIQEGERK